MGRVKTLIHVHTNYSFDSNISLEALTGFLVHNEFSCIAVTDHDTIEGAKRLRNLTDVQVIVGEEISTRDGHLMGLFLEEGVSPGMSARDTALAIREQGGLVFVPHPFVSAFGCGLGSSIWSIVDLIDAVEIRNGQNLFTQADKRAKRLADSKGLVQYVGADSHMSGSIAPCYQMMDSFADAAGFLESLRTAELFPGRHPLWYFAATGYRLARHFAGWGMPMGFGTEMPKTRALSPDATFVTSV